ncbi:inositol-pentakisphosphate 2-kinase-like isoform X1 [Maniola jurtina]|uniref:inositol-pentakisphosphate 2-kinase-like isoform X1 n=1 Tax=Maniola jurtina TaxID=191418 RepID=UPI001E68E29B|nr:inositol-pentakisphosphate 2-kinase-like isoform X1 [Maniola jurtina]
MMSLIGKKYKYISEGNAHIVLHIIDTNYVIRIIKENGHTTNLDTISNSVNFVNLVMVPLIFGSYNHFHEVITLSSEDIDYLAVDLKEIRPKHRQVKSVFSKFAIKAPNLAMITPNSVNYCLELKPKEGYLSETFKNTSKCYYCLKQFLKMSENQIEHRSDYCPLDLFSGNKTRMKRALLNLLRNPQNNLKLFKNENIVYKEHSNMKNFQDFIKSNLFDSVNMFLDFIIEILLSDGNSNLTVNESPESTIKKPETCIEDMNLNPKSFLHKLLDIQKLSETLEIDYSDSKTDEDLEYVLALLTQIKQHNLDLTKENDRKRFLNIVEDKHLALISAVAKDCSIMISYSLVANDNVPSVKLGEQDIFYRVSVTDLEPKAAKTLVKRRKTEKLLLEIYEKNLKT